MSNDFLLGPNGVEEVEMDETEQDEALIQAVREHPTVKSLVQRLENGQLTKAALTQDLVFFFRESQSGRIVTLRKSEVLAPQPAQQTYDQDDGLTWPQITSVRGSISADVEVEDVEVEAEVETEADANRSENSNSVEEPEFESIMLQNQQELTKNWKNKQNIDFERTLIKIRKVDKALAEGEHIPEMDELNMDEELYFEYDDDNDEDDIDVPELSQELEVEKILKLPNQVQNSENTPKKLETKTIDAQPQTEEHIKGESQMEVGQSTDDIAGKKSEQLQLDESAIFPQEVIVPIVSGQLETLLESSEKETIVKNSLQNESDTYLAEELADTIPQEDNVPEQPKVNETTYFMDLESSDSEHETIDEGAKVELIKSEETSEPSEVESIENSCDESSIIATQYDSEFEVEMSNLKSQEQPIAPNVENIQNQFPPSLELRTGGSVSKTFLEAEMPILEQEEQEIPSTLPLLPRMVSTPTSVAEKTPEAEILEVDNVLQPSNQNQQNNPKSSPNFKKNKKKRKLDIKKKWKFPSRRPRICPVEGCGKVLGNLYAFNNHLGTQHTKATCEHCNLTFDRIIQLTNHMNDMHTPEDRKVVRKKVGRKPQPKPEIPPPPPCYPCTKCPSTFTYAHGLTRHLRRLHKVADGYKTSSCYFCSREFFSYFELSAHMHTHTMEKAHTCRLCAKDFTRKSYLQLHIATVHAPNGSRKPKPKKFLCPTCGKGFGGSGNLKYHIEDVHLKLRPFGCDLCDAKFGRKGSLEKHKMVVHNNKRDFVCDRCGKNFATNVLVKIHVQAVHEKTRHQCPHCEKTYSQKGHMLAHIKRTHTEGYQPPTYFCTVKKCRKSFAIRLNRDEHIMRFHTKERPFKCEHKKCKMAFVTSSERRSHSASHIKGEPYRCGECESAFKSKQRLRTHLRNVHKFPVLTARKTVDEMDIT